jgi:uncharacterized protein YegL
MVNWLVDYINKDLAKTTAKDKDDFRPLAFI